MITSKSATDTTIPVGTPSQAAPRRGTHKAKRALKSKPAPKGKPSTQPQSKQDRVLAMLRQREGTTIPVVMKATGWQKHSVHGFFSGVVRKKLRLKLESTKVGDKRIYRIGGEASPKVSSSRPQTKRRTA